METICVYPYKKRNPKFEILNPKQYQNQKTQIKTGRIFRF